MSRESMDFDVVIVGAGPAGLSAAIRVKQLNPELQVVVVEKGSEVGAHILSGAVIETKALDELLPEWQTMNSPVKTAVSSEKFMFLKEKSAINLPSFMLIPQQRNHGNYIVSLGNVCRWLAEQAETLGIEIFPGFAASEVLYNENEEVVGIATGDMGVAKDGSEKATYQAGYELRAKYTLFSEGCRGHLGKQLMSKFNLTNDDSPQHYGIGIKELWKVPEELHEEGLVLHSAGWPLDSATYGGSFMYHLEDNQIAVGFVIGLNYQNPHLSPFEEFQRFKTHPDIAKYFAGSERISYGARAINEGGLQAIPKLTMPGALLAGCEAGFLNLPKIKGTHTAMKSGMLAAEAIVAAINDNQDIADYEDKIKDSWIYEELYRARNTYPAFHKWGMVGGILFTGIDQILFRGKMPFTMTIAEPDHKSLLPAEQCSVIEYPKPDNVLTFDRLSSVYISNTNHEEDQPVHLQLRDESIPIEHNLAIYAEPAQRYCPAGVYEIVDDEENGGQRLQINAQNCVHCKTCDIKDPMQNINWVVPEGAGGPNYPNM